MSSPDPVVSGKISISSPAFQRGLKALKDQLPLIAVRNFQDALRVHGGKWNQKQLEVVNQFLGEAMIRSGKYTEGLQVLSSLPQTPANNYWTAIGLIGQGSLIRALQWLTHTEIPKNSQWAPYYLQTRAVIAGRLNDQQLLETSLKELVSLQAGAISARAAIWLASLHMQNKQYDQALETLTPLLTRHEDPPAWLSNLIPLVRIVQAQIMGAQGQWDPAIAQLKNLAESPKLPIKYKNLAQVTIALLHLDRDKDQAKAHTGKPDEPSPVEESTPGDESNVAKNYLGEDQLLAFISSNPDSQLLTDVFRVLLQEKTFQSNPQALEKLTSWANDTNSTRQPLAAYALCEIFNREKDYEGLISLTRKTLKQAPAHPASEALLIKTLHTLLQLGYVDQADSLLKEFPSFQSVAVRFQAGRIAYEQQRFEEALQLFQSTFWEGGDRLMNTSLYNATLAALELSDRNALDAIMQQAVMDSNLREKLAYEQAHYIAQRMMPEAQQALQSMINEFPNSPWVIPAKLDLIEVLLNQNPPDVKEAARQMNLFPKDKLDAQAKLRYARLNIILLEIQQSWDKAIQAARDALKQYPDAPCADAIQLKLGELLYKSGSFNESLLVLQPFSERYPDSDLKRPAMFLAGRAAEQCNTQDSLDTALGLFQQLADTPGRLSSSSKVEIAALLLRTGKTQETIDYLNRLLQQRLSQPLRLQALSILAEAWASMGDSAPDSLVTARRLCTQMLEMPNIPLHWKFKALAQRAQFAEKQGNLNAALEDYLSILQYAPTNDQASSRKDWFWFYSAGFSALHILELRQDWQAALDLAIRLSKTSGPKAADAANRARRIRLEHFIWNDIDLEPISFPDSGQQKNPVPQLEPAES